MIRVAVGVLVLLALSGAAWAQGLTGFQGGEGPLEIDAEQGIEWQRDRKIYIARGNAVARREDLSVSADVLTAYYRVTQEGRNQIYRIDAEGNVLIASPNERVYADSGVYSVDEGVMQLVGSALKLETPSEVITARDSLEYWEDYEGTPVAVARGDAVAERTAEGQRIRGDVLTATLRPNEEDRLEISQVDAFGDVRIATETEFARGDRGVYYVREQLALLEGNVKITRGENQLNGERVEIDLRTGVSRLLSEGDKRVRGLLSPGDVQPGTETQ